MSSKLLVIKTFYILFFVSLTNLLFGQVVFNQEIIKGGIYCIGFPMGATYINQPYTVHFPNIGVLEKVTITAYCQVKNFNIPIDVDFNVNGNTVSLTNNNIYSYVRYGDLEGNNLTGAIGYYILQKDIINEAYISNDSLVIFIEKNLIPPNDSPNQFLTGFYINIFYKLETGSSFTFQQYLNSGYDGLSKSTILNVNNLKNTSDDTFLGIFTDRIGQTLEDGYKFYLNSTQIGVINMVNEPFNNSGVMGSFHFNNGISYGIFNNDPNLPISGSNGVMKLPANLINNFNAKVEYINGVLNMPNNILLGYNLVYSTPCEPFEYTYPNDSTLCQGATLQLQASGGQRYKWLPETGLSCYDCANPIFTADTTTFYSLQIFNTDSCSIIRTIRLFVDEPDSISTIDSSPSFCGGATGSISMKNNPIYAHYSIDGVSFPAGNNLSNISAGTHQVVGISEYGCPSFPISVQIDSFNTTVADFWRSPLEGNAPLNVIIENKSQQANYFLWHVDTLFFQTISNPYTFTEPGWHTITLYAWKYDTLCTDTLSKQVFVRIPLIVPTAFTPNNDGENDVWELPYIDILFPENTVSIYNRWGEQLFKSIQGNYATHPWDGTFEGKQLPVDTYFYVIETNHPDFDNKNGAVSIIKK